MKKFLALTLFVSAPCLLMIVSTSACSDARQEAPAQERATQTSRRDSTSDLEQKISQIAATSGGTVGVSAIHVETGRRVSLNGAERFPMASVYKLPIALQLLRRVERGEVRLSDTIKLSEHDFRPGVSPVIKLAKGKSITLTIDRLLELMLGDSDNTASDILLRQAGGPEAVTARMRELGVTGIDVNRSEGQMTFDFRGVHEPPPEPEWTLALFEKLGAEVKPAEREMAANADSNDTRDSSTPEAMTDLLIRLHRGEVLASGNNERVLRIMTASPTGPTRLKGLLPAGTPVAHKTGTRGGITNDVGIVTLPGNSGHLVIAVFVKASTKSVEERERAIAEIARAAYDYFVSLQPTDK